MDYRDEIKEILNNKRIWGDRSHIFKIQNVNDDNLEFMKRLLKQKSRTQKELIRLSLVVESMKENIVKIISFFLGVLASIMALGEIISKVNGGYELIMSKVITWVVILFLIFFYIGYRGQKSYNLKLEMINLIIEEIISENKSIEN